MTRVKICGLTRPQDAALAAELGAWALGVIFAPESPRRISLMQAAEVLAAAGGDIERIGVFVNASLGEIEEAVSACGLTAVQLHGEETPQFCSEVRHLTGVLVIKALRVREEGTVKDVVQFDTNLVLLDTYQPGLAGGTGKAFEWRWAAALDEDIRQNRLILSGGLNPENVAQAVLTVSPFAVDLASGVESQPGVKDPKKMKRLFAALKDLTRE